MQALTQQQTLPMGAEPPGRDAELVPDFGWSAETPHTQAYLLKSLRDLLKLAHRPRGRVLDLGCGNGALCQQLDGWGYTVVGVDPSESGIAQATQRCPHLSFHKAVANPAELALLQLPPFDLVISTEVVEHCPAPRNWAAAAFAALSPGGLLICSTPYHGYLKNLVLALSGRLDAHFTVLWDGGHIKFWSRSTLSQLLSEAGFVDLQFRGAGRLPWLWKSMVLSGRKP